MNRLVASLILVSATELSTLPPIHAITLEMVPIGNAGNAPYGDLGANVGGVAYPFRIAKYEVTAGQYAEFLNAVAGDDPHGLYNDQMNDPLNPLRTNILRTGSSPNFTYSVPVDWADRPVNYVSLWDAARFANWLHNGQPTGPQGPGTTEDGAYHDVGNEALFGRNAGAKFFLPTEDEWFKAAYHDKTAGLANSYFSYPTGGTPSGMPGNDISEATRPGNNANYAITNRPPFPPVYAIGPPYYRTVVGEFELSASPYGTFDQGGNVFEWTETFRTTDFGGPGYVRRGGSFDSPVDTLNLQVGGVQPASTELWYIGLRVASIPEPNSAVLGVLGLLTIAHRRRTKSLLQAKPQRRARLVCTR